jgi:hypothetical protein
VRSRHATTAIQRAENFGRHRTLGTSDDRAWFLKNSRWEDSTWILAPTNALEERLPVRLHWDFSVEDGCTVSPTRAMPRCCKPASG